jgi:hypothetical protein
MASLEELSAEIADLRHRVQTTESTLEIHSLKARYGELVDQRYSAGSVVDSETLAQLAHDGAALFTEDAVWDGGPKLGVARGRVAIADRLRNPTLTFSRHLFVKPRITVENDEAQGRWDILCPCRLPDGSSWWMCGYEDDTYARVDGVWLHRSMNLTTIFMGPVDKGWSKILA